MMSLDATRMGCFFSQAWNPLNKSEKEKRETKERVGLYQEARRRSTYPGKNQSVSIGSVHFLSTAPHLVQLQLLIFLFLLFGPLFSPSTRFNQPRPFPVRRIEIDPNPKLSNTHTHKHATHSTQTQPKLHW